MANKDSEPADLTRGSIRRIKRVLDKVEGGGNFNITPPKSVSPSPYGGIRAKVSEKVYGGSFNSPGTGKAKLYHKNSVGAWTEYDEVEVRNQFASDIEVDLGIIICWIDGEWFVIAAECEA